MGLFGLRRESANASRVVPAYFLARLVEICFGDTYAFRRQIVAAQMSCIFCRSNANLTDEHVFPAFMGGELIVKDGSCETCNRDFGVAEAYASA